MGSNNGDSESCYTGDVVMVFEGNLRGAIAFSSLGLVATGSLSLLCIWSTLNTLKQGISHLKRLHQIPCHRCQYFTGDYRLKCPVQPLIACTDEAISCVDFAIGSAQKGIQPCFRKELQKDRKTDQGKETPRVGKTLF